MGLVRMSSISILQKNTISLSLLTDLCVQPVFDIRFDSFHFIFTTVTWTLVTADFYTIAWTLVTADFYTIASMCGTGPDVKYMMA